VCEFLNVDPPYQIAISRTGSRLQVLVNDERIRFIYEHTYKLTTRRNERRRMVWHSDVVTLWLDIY